MSDTPAPSGTQSPDHSLEGAAHRIEGLLFPTKDKVDSDPTPDPKTRTEPKDAPPAREDDDQPPAGDEPPAREEDEPPAKSEDDAEDDESRPTPRKFKVKVDGQELEVPEDELISGYSRQQDYTRKTTKLAEERKAFEEKEVAAVRAERQKYAEYLTKLDEITQPPKVDWDKLRNEVPPDVFAAAYADHDRATKQNEAVRAERDRVNKQQAEDARKEYGKYVDAENEKLLTARPEWRDPEKGKAARLEIVDYARKQGLSDAEIMNITDHRVILFLEKAMRLDKQAAGKPEVRNKIDKVLVDAAPGTTSQPRAKGTKLQQAKGRLAKSGSLDDAAAAIANLLGD